VSSVSFGILGARGRLPGILRLTANTPLSKDDGHFLLEGYLNFRCVSAFFSPAISISDSRRMIRTLRRVVPFSAEVAVARLWRLAMASRAVRAGGALVSLRGLHVSDLPRSYW